ncbi:MAG: PhoH family protein [Proteobacteria bacterium]|nr:PhoH family protein [Pseudomonadota bacterium]
MAKRNRARLSTTRHKSEGRKSKSERQDQKSYRSADIYTLHPDHPGNFHPGHANLDTAYSMTRDRRPLEARTPAQKKYLCAIKSHCLTFGIGPAGTGKSYCATAMAADALASGRIERIILTRPAVEAGEQLGHLPGDLNEKFSVYIDPFRDILHQRLGKGAVEYNLRHGRIVAAPLAFMRGKTFGSDTFVILDEAQNTSIAQMKMFLTRIGEDCKVVVNGDVNQSDIRGPNGLADAIERLRGLPGVRIHEFDREDIVRSGLVRAVIDRYEVEA